MLLVLALAIRGAAVYEGENGLLYNDETMTILTGYNTENFNGKLVIPNTVVSIAAEAFKSCSQLKGDFEIPSSVEVIGVSAFNGCVNLGTVTIGPSVKLISDSAFVGCNFKLIKIEADGLTIGESGISFRTGEVRLSGKNVELKKNAVFNYASSFMQSTVTITGENFTFNTGCLRARSITVDVNHSKFAEQVMNRDDPEVHKYIVRGDNNTFDKAALGLSYPKGKPADTSIHLTAAKTTGNLGLFDEGFGVVNVSFASFGRSVLSGCKAEELYISFCDGITEIPAGSFQKLPIKGTIYFPPSVVKIDENAFEGCTGITGFAFTKPNNVYSSYDGVLMDSTGEKIFLFPQGKTGSYTIPRTLKHLPRISQYTFANLNHIAVDDANPYFFGAAGLVCDKQTGFVLVCPKAMTGELVIPTTVKGIGPSSFKGCMNLSKIVIGAHIQTISTAAFSGAQFGVAEIIAAGLTVQNNAFYTAEGNLSIRGDNIVLNRYGAYLSGEHELRIWGSNIQFKALSIHGRFVNINVTDSVMTGNGKLEGIMSWDYTGGYTKSITIVGDRVTLQDKPLQCRCGSNMDPRNYIIDIKHASVHNDIGRIERFSSLSLTLSEVAPYTVTANSIVSCASVNLELLDTVKTIPRHCFYNALCFTSFNIGKYVTTIEREAFLGCSKITQFLVEGDHFASEDGVVYDKAMKTLILFPEGKTGTFKIPATVTELWVTPMSFPNIEKFDVENNPRFGTEAGLLVDKIEKKIVVCPGALHLANLTISDSIAIIGTYAFAYCDWGTITIGTNVKTIEESAFREANVSLSITCNGLELAKDAIYKIRGRVNISGTGLRVRQNGLYVSEQFAGVNAKLLADTKDYYLNITGEDLVFDTDSLYASRMVLDVRRTVFGDRAFMTPKTYQTITALSLKGEQCQTGYYSFTLVNSDGSEPADYYVQLTNLNANGPIGQLQGLGTITVTFSHVEGNPVAGISGTQELTVGLSDNVTSLPDGAFSGDGGLTGEFYISKSVEYISTGAFVGQAITAYKVDEANPNYISVDGVVFNKAKTDIILFPEAKEGTYTILPTVQSVDPQHHLFPRITALKVDSNSATFSEYNGILLTKDGSKVVRCPGAWTGPFECPSTISEIGPYSFHKCSLTEVEIGPTTKIIRSHAFDRCKCTTLRIDGAGTALEQGCMQYLSGNVEIRGNDMVFWNQSVCLAASGTAEPNTLTVLGSGHVFHEGSLSSVVMDVTVSNSIFHKSATSEVQSLSVFRMYGNNNTFDDGALEVVQSSAQVDIDRTLSLTNLHSLGSIGMLQGFKEIKITFAEMKGEGTMSGVQNPQKLTVEILEGVTSIPARAFAGVNELDGEVVLPSSLTNVYTSAFNGAGRITSVLFKGKDRGLLANPILTIGPAAFANCHALARVVFEYHEAEVSIDETAFADDVSALEIVFSHGTVTPAPPAPEPSTGSRVIIIAVCSAVSALAAIVIIVIVVLLFRRKTSNKDKQPYSQYEAPHSGFPYTVGEWSYVTEDAQSLN